MPGIYDARDPGATPGPARVYSLLVVLQRRGGSGPAVIIIIAVVAIVAAGATGCGGPVDSRPPRADAGPVTNRGTGGTMRTIDPVHDSGPVAAVDVGWPAVSGCASGLPPSPRFSADQIPPVAIGCASSSIVILRVSDAAAQGMVFTARLDPPVFGLSLDFDPDLCASDVDAPISLVVNQFAFRPGASFTTSLWITPMGPPPQPSSVFTLHINTVAVDFTLNPDLVDFGTLATGVYQTMPIGITNAPDGAPIDGVFPSQQRQGPFVILPTPVPDQPSLQPGQSRQMLQAVLNTQATGTFEASFLVSAFPPGTLVAPACGVVRPLTVRAQIVAPAPSP